jgi:hypothetical protein
MIDEVWNEETFRQRQISRAERSERYMAELCGRFLDRDRATGAKRMYDQHAAEVWVCSQLATWPDLKSETALLAALEDLKDRSPVPPLGVHDPAFFEEWRKNTIGAFRRKFSRSS